MLIDLAIDLFSFSFKEEETFFKTHFFTRLLTAFALFFPSLLLYCFVTFGKSLFHGEVIPLSISIFAYQGIMFAAATYSSMFTQRFSSISNTFTVLNISLERFTIVSLVALIGFNALLFLSSLGEEEVS
jgi:hypothetical protein